MKVNLSFHGMEDFKDRIDGGAVGAVFQFRDLRFLHAYEFAEFG